MIDVLVRRATRRDSREFLGLLVDLANFEHLDPPSDAARRRIVRDIFGRKKRVNLILATTMGKKKRKAVGYALYFFTYSSFLARPTLYLEDIFVKEEYRRIGVGSKLFLECVREAVRQKCGRMEWAVLEWNRKAIRFYEKAGARKLDEWSTFRLDEKALMKLYSRNSRSSPH